MTYSAEGGNKTSRSTEANVQIRFQTALAKNRIINLDFTVFDSNGQNDSPCDVILRTPLVDDVHMHIMTEDSELYYSITCYNMLSHNRNCILGCGIGCMMVRGA
jgi:hypothetical protein